MKIKFCSPGSVELKMIGVSFVAGGSSATIQHFKLHSTLCNRVNL